jgi:NADPH:quinone reductase
MKAVMITAPGKPDVLKISERVKPTPAKGQVLIKVLAAGVNRPDVSQRKGHYPPPLGASDIPGLELAGIIEKIGDNISMFKPGDRVCALVTGGGYAEYCIAPEGQCLPIPGELTFTEAASLPETYFTVWSNVFDRGHFKSGERFLVHGGTSGIGVTAIQLVKAFGGIIFATAGSDEKCDFCRTLGADKVINYKTQDFKDVIIQETDNRGVDLILDMIGGPYTQTNLECLTEEGRLVLINVMKGDDVSLKLSMIMRKRLTITGSTLRARDVAFKTEVAASLRKYVWPLFEQRKLRPIVYKVFPLNEAAAAHELMESSTHMGKIVLEINSHS